MTRSALCRLVSAVLRTVTTHGPGLRNQSNEKVGHTEKGGSIFAQLPARSSKSAISLVLREPLVGLCRVPAQKNVASVLRDKWRYHFTTLDQDLLHFGVPDGEKFWKGG